jgi:hypothetical protein
MSSFANPPPPLFPPGSPTHPAAAPLPAAAQYLNLEHGQRALTALPQCINGILGAPAAATVHERELLAVLSLLMNSLVVEVVAGGAATKGVSRHMSDAALQGFCHLHHL